MKIVSIKNTKILAEAVCDKISIPLNKTVRRDFKDRELTVGFEESVRGDKVFIIGSTNVLRGEDNLMELCMLIRAAKSANAKEIIVITPYFGWGRADRKDLERSCVTSKLVADFIEIAGATQIVTFDLHAIQMQNFFDIPSDHFTFDKIVADYLNKNVTDDYILASPDMGAAKRTQKIADRVNKDFVVFYKKRDKNNNIEEMKILGDVDGKHVVLCDDISDSGGTLCKAAELAKKQGAKSVIAICSHGVFSGDAIQNIDKSCIDKMLVTNSIPEVDFKTSSKFEILDISKMLATIINRINDNQSLSDI